MSTFNYLEERQLYDAMANNASDRLLLCLCIDASFSMRMERRLEEVNKEVRALIEELKEDPYAADSVELAVLSFGGNTSEIICPFDTVHRVRYRDIKAKGNTPLGSAVENAIRLIDERKNVLSEHGIAQYKPWLIIISDGDATDNYKEAARKLVQRQIDGSLKVEVVHIGNEAAGTLKMFSKDGKVSAMNTLRLKDFFDWISKSMSKINKSTPGVNELDSDEWDEE